MVASRTLAPLRGGPEKVGKKGNFPSGQDIKKYIWLSILPRYHATIA